MKSLSFALLYLFGTFATASAESFNPYKSCDLMILQRTSVQASSTVHSVQDYLSLVDDSNYEQVKRSVDTSATIYGYFTGKYDEFNEKRRRLYEKEEMHDSLDVARTAVFSLMPSTNDWLKCIQKMADAEGESSRLLLWYEDIKKDYVVVTIRWKPAPGVGTIRLTSNVVNGYVADAPTGKLFRDSNRLLPNFISPPNDFTVGDYKYTIRRAGNQEVQIAVNGDAGVGANPVHMAAELVLPAWVDLSASPKASEGAGAPVLDSDLNPAVPINCSPGGAGVRKDPILSLYDLALLKGAVATADSAHSPYHAISHLNDGAVGDCMSWIPQENPQTAFPLQQPNWAMIDLKRDYWIHSIYVTNGHFDRWTSETRAFIARDGHPDQWVQVGGLTAPFKLHQPISIQPQWGRYVKIELYSTSLAPRLDEIEIYGDSHR